MYDVLVLVFLVMDFEDLLECLVLRVPGFSTPYQRYNLLCAISANKIVGWKLYKDIKG
jgi:hypothetical protein